MDVTTCMEKLEDFMMINPEEKRWHESSARVKQRLRKCNIETFVYPKHIMEHAISTNEVPPCIFVPSQDVLR